MLDPPQTYHLSNWNRLTDQQRIAFLRQISEQRGRDPRIRELVFAILQQAGVDQREYQQQAAVLLRWVQQNILYLNEPGEVIQDPLYTLNKRAGDCDDVADLLGSMFEAARLPWRYVLSGTAPNGQKIRWIEGQPLPPRIKWAHVYLMVGVPPFRPVQWFFAEPSIKGVPLGWDVIQAAQGQIPGTVPASVLPELAQMAGPDLTKPETESGKGWLDWWDWTEFHRQVAMSVAVGLASTAILVGLKRYTKIFPK
jgi:hypothetical protein